MKKFFALLMVVLMVISMCVNVYANDDFYLTDGEIELTDVINTGREGDIVTIAVFNRGADFTDKEYWLGDNYKNCVYLKEVKLDKNRGYTFDFVLPQVGVYNVYVGNKEFETVDEKSITYVNKTNNEAALESIKNAESAEALAALLENKNSLGLFDEIFNNCDFSALADILFKSVSQREIDCTQMIEYAEKAAAVCAIKKEINVENEKIIKCLHFDEKAQKYYRTDFDAEIIAALKKEKIDSVEKINSVVNEQIVLCTVNKNDGTGDVKNAVTDYADEFGFDTSKLDDTLVENIISQSQKSEFKSAAEIKSIIKNYVPTADKGEKESAGGGGGGKSTSSNPLKGVELTAEDNSNIQTADVFDDLKDVEWAKGSISQLYYKGIINGTTEDTFSPNQTVKREEFAKMLMLTFKVDLVSGEGYFDDVTADDWCYDYVNSMYLAGAANGIGNKIFGKGTDISRQDLCTMISRMFDIAEIPLENTASEAFADDANIADYAKDAVYKMKGEGLISGYEDGTFKPGNGTTRAEAAKIIYSALLRINKFKDDK